MKITKRDGSVEKLSFDKILYRLRKLCTDKALGQLRTIDPDVIALQVVSSIYDGVTSSELDEEAARVAVSLTENPDYPKLAARIIISNLHKNTNECFSQVLETLYENGCVADDVIAICREHKNKLNFAIDYNRDYNFDYFGFKTLERGYLLRVHSNGKMRVVERPQHMFMRVCLGIHKHDIDNVLKTYELMSQGYYIHATPTLFNAGTRLPQMSSCFLQSGGVDSVDGIYKSISDCARISRLAGGIGLHIHDIRAKGSLIKGTNGTSDGIVPMIKVYNETAKYINQSGKRKGSFALYIEPWHADVMEFLDLKKNQGHEDMRARDLFYAMWLPDLFMRKVEANEEWHLMCPSECPGLSDAYGAAFEELYTKYVAENKHRSVVKAQDVWFKILDAQIETGVPYLLYKDAANEKSNQKNLGTIKSSNLCAEILEYSDEHETAVCNLCSISLPKFVTNDGFDHTKLHDVAKSVVLAMNRVIDNNWYPTPEAARSNERHRPIGVGIQGLHDVFQMLRHDFDSQEAKTLNKEIFETIYHGTLEGSMELAKEFGPYETFAGSPASQGLLQFDLWSRRENVPVEVYLSGRWDFQSLKEDIKVHGLRNSLLTAIMPTASTAQILGNTECIEAMDSCIFKRKVLSGEFTVVNKHLVADLLKAGLWTKEMKEKIIAREGSIQNIPEMSQKVKSLYRNVWELSQKTLIDLSADRAPFIDQTQSLNLFVANPTHKKLTSMHFYAWKKGLKTGMYYLRSKASASAAKFSVDAETENAAKLACSLENKEDCLMCSA